MIGSKLYAWYYAAERKHQFWLRSTEKSGKRKEKFKLF